MTAALTEKKRALLESALALLRAGADPHEITVSAIAANAGVGKGTVYEYFKSKEELVSAAIYYNLQLLSTRTAQAVQNQNSFDGKLTALFDCIDQFITCNQQLLRPALDAALEADGQRAGASCPFCSEDAHSLSAPLRDLISRGVAEKLFPQPEETYCKMVIEGMSVAYVYTAHYPGETKNISHVRKNARRMLVSALCAFS